MDRTNLDIYGHAVLPWSRAEKQLLDTTDPNRTWFLATVRPDGRPHVAGVGALWVDGRVYFTSGPGTRKSRNLAGNPNCVMSVKLADLDLIVEGVATRVTDRLTIRRLAKRYAAQGWPAEAEDDALTAPFSAPSAGRPPWYLYQVMPTVAFGVATAEPHGATRWRFDV